MAKKLVTLRALARIDYNGGTFIPGTEKDTFECDPAEAARLKGLCVAEAFTAESPTPARESKPTAAELEAQAQVELAAQANADLLAKIAAAATHEDLEALIPEEEPADPDFALALREALTARMTELET